MASRLEPEKNIVLAINAMCEVVKQRPQVGLVIVGSGSEEQQLKLKVRNCGLAANIIFENWIDKSTLYSYYKTTDLFLSTSLYEGYGLTLAEAQAAGCPIISTDVGVARDVGARLMRLDAGVVAEGITQIIKD